MASARKNSEIRIVCTEDNCNVCTDLSVYTFYHHTLNRLPPNYKPYQKEYECACGLFFPDLMEAGYHSADMRLKKDRRHHKIDRNDSVDIGQHIPEIEKMALNFRHNLKRQGEIVIKDLTRGKENGHRRPPAETPNDDRMEDRSASRGPTRNNGNSNELPVQLRRTPSRSTTPESAPMPSEHSSGDRCASAPKKDVPFKLKPSWARKYEGQKRKSGQRQEADANEPKTPKTPQNTPAYSDHRDSDEGRHSRSRSQSGSVERDDRQRSRSPAATANRDSESEVELEQRIIVDELRRATGSASGAQRVPNPALQGDLKLRHDDNAARDSVCGSRGAPDGGRATSQVQNQGDLRVVEASENPTHRIHFFAGVQPRSQYERPGGYVLYDYDASIWEKYVGQPWSSVPQDPEELPLDRHGTGYQWEDRVPRYQSRSPGQTDHNRHGGARDAADNNPQNASSCGPDAAVEVDACADRKRGRSETRRVTASTVRRDDADENARSAPSSSYVAQQPSQPPRKRGRARRTPAPEEDDEYRPAGVYNPADFPLRDEDGVYTRTRSRSRSRSMVRETTPPIYDDDHVFDWEKDLDEIDRHHGRRRRSSSDK